jgi:hypothetical protein
MKLELADLYYIPNFHFASGSTKDKYLLVLTRNNNNTIVLSLPTSKGRVPAHLENGQFGCINCDASLFNCYRFLNGVDITEDRPSFSFLLTHFFMGNGFRIGVQILLKWIILLKMLIIFLEEN